MKPDWKPIAEIPDYMKDGRQVLCLSWSFFGDVPEDVTVDNPELFFCVVQWYQYGPDDGRFEGYYDATTPQPVFYCDLLDELKACGR